MPKRGGSRKKAAPGAGKVTSASAFVKNHDSPESKKYFALKRALIDFCYKTGAKQAAARDKLAAALA